MSKNILMVFLKPFVKGKVKTRLAKDIGDHQALKLYKMLVDHTIKEVKKFPDDIALCFCYSEDPDASTQYPGKHKYMVQSGETLGERMHNALEWADQQGFQKKVIIGSDCPVLSVAHLIEAYQQLGSNDLVLGPAKDGGYYLIGMKKLHPVLFQNIHWSTNTVYAATLKKIYENELSVGKLETLFDIDDLEDLKSAPPFLRKLGIANLLFL